jgi:Domain of unknown function (DUF4407)
MNRFRRMLIACSGAVGHVLEKPECRGDAMKHAMIGAFVLLTAIFAFFSSTFAFYTGISSLPLAIVLGVAWALMIFTLDRFIVSGIRKSDVEGLPFEQRFRRRLVEWIIALPRLVLAALISFVVATPLELRFFQREIDAQLAQNQTIARQTAGKQLDAEFALIPELRQKNDELRKSIADAWNKHAAAQTLANKESVGQAGYTRLIGDGPVYRKLKAQADQLEQLAQQTAKTNTAAIAINDARIAELEAERQRRLAQFVKAIDNSGGFLDRYRALGQMAKANDDVRTARLFLILLVLAIELTPVITKLLLRRGPYDDFMDTGDHDVRVTEMIKRSNMNDDAHTKVTLHSRDNAERERLEETLTRETFGWNTVEKLVAPELEEAQRELLRASIRQWRQKQRSGFGPGKAAKLTVRQPPGAEERPS